VIEKMNELQEQMAEALEIPEPKGFMDLTYAEFVEKDMDDLFPDMTEWQRVALENWMDLWKENPVKPKRPVEQVRRMFTSDDVKADMIRAMEAEQKKPKEVIHFQSFDPHGSKGPGVYCSCGMYKVHNRGKVLAAWADKHFTKYNHYWKRT
jgi:hypothetical protein